MTPLERQLEEALDRIHTILYALDPLSPTCDSNHVWYEIGRAQMEAKLALGSRATAKGLRPTTATAQS